MPGDDQEVKAGKLALEGAWDVESVNGENYREQSLNHRAIFLFAAGQATFINCRAETPTSPCVELREDRVSVPYTTKNGQLNTDVESLPAHLAYKIKGTVLTFEAPQTKMILNRLASFCSDDADCKTQGAGTCNLQTNACK